MRSHPIDVDFFCTYLTATGTVEWTGNNYLAMNMVKAIKGDSFRGSIHVTISGITKDIYSDDASEFVKVCHRPLARILRDKYPFGACVVPIPSSKTTDVGCSKFRTYAIAKRLVAVAGKNYCCSPILLFRSEMPLSRRGGNRSTYYIESQIIINGQTDKPIILFDDVMTSGAHLKAASWKLEGNGMNVIGAITFARVVKDNTIAPFGPHTEQLDIAKPQELWDF